MIRLGRDVARAVRKTVEESGSDLILLGWPGDAGTSGRVFGKIIDQIVDNPPTDVAVVRYQHNRLPRSILVPIAGGPNGRLAARIAASLAANSGTDPVRVTALHVLRQGADTEDREHALQILSDTVRDIQYPFERKLAEGNDVVETILSEAKEYDLIVIGATNEPLFKNLLLGNVPEQIVKRSNTTTIIVKRRHGPIKALLRETVLPPSTSIN